MAQLFHMATYIRVNINVSWQCQAITVDLSEVRSSDNYMMVGDFQIYTPAIKY